MRLKSSYGSDILVDVEVLTIGQSEAIDVIKKLNKDDTVHGIIVQIPLPDTSQTNEILNTVAPEKDVDGLRDSSAPWPLHADEAQGSGEKRTKRTSGTESESRSQTDTAIRREPAGLAGLSSQQGGVVYGSGFDAPTPMAINWLLTGYNVELQGRKIVIVGHGRLVGKPLAKMWQHSGFDVTIVDKKVADLKEITRHADVLVCATGVPGLITSGMVNPEAAIVDAGVATDSNGLVGDVAASVRNLPNITITPEKGGVGPLTVCALFENVIQAARNSKS